ncbi:hypothetical protein ALC57_09369 [Trachymyrmex cornetzi]|uniref:Uncharacterized protein n=1 Tax=Trachymyrmex cornetzi TaxID=471704 RepID=A0A195DZG2_9HYME|nr:hypothetical protein ALC57_09369 [Trachymyrmex cornetzi]
MQYTPSSWLKELFARHHTESPRSMSYGPFSKTVYANFTETKNISGILRVLTNHSGLLTNVRSPSLRRLAPTTFGSDRLYQRRRCHPFDVAKWRRRVGGVSVRTVLDVAQSAYVRNNVPADPTSASVTDRAAYRTRSWHRGPITRASDTVVLLPVTLHVADARYYHPPPPSYTAERNRVHGVRVTRLRSTRKRT